MGVRATKMRFGVPNNVWKPITQRMTSMTKKKASKEQLLHCACTHVLARAVKSFYSDAAGYIPNDVIDHVREVMRRVNEEEK